MTSTYQMIATNTLSSTASTVTFSSISGAYTDLVLVVNLKAAAGANAYPIIKFNNDGTSVYSSTPISGSGSAASSSRTTSGPGYITQSAVESSTDFNFNGIYNIQNYSNTTTYKTLVGRCNNASNRVEAIVTLWRNTAAINRIDLDNFNQDFAIGCTFTIYGIKAE